MSIRYRDIVLPSGAFDRVALMRLAVAKARVEHAHQVPWPDALRFGLDQVWQSARMLRTSLRDDAGSAAQTAIERAAVACDAAAALAEMAIPPRPAEAAQHRQRASELRMPAQGRDGDASKNVAEAA